MKEPEEEVEEVEEAESSDGVIEVTSPKGERGGKESLRNGLHTERHRVLYHRRRWACIGDAMLGVQFQSSKNALFLQTALSCPTPAISLFTARLMINP